MAEYKLSYTAAQINDRLGKVTALSEDVGSLQENVQVISDDVQVKAEIVTLSTEEYEALEANESTNANTLYMLTDAEDDTSVLYTEQTLTDEQKAQARENIGAVKSWNDLDDKPTTLPNPNALTFTGAVTGTYDGSSAQTVNIPVAPVSSVNGKTGDVTIDIPDIPVTSVNGQTGDVTIDIPANLSGLSDDANHRTVTDAEKSAWNAKSDFSGSYNDLTDKPTQLPSVTSSDNGAFLRVVDGAWAATTVPNAEEASF